MQPVQDLTVETRVSRTQYQYSLEDPGRQGAGRVGAAVWSTSSKTLPQLRDVASDQQNEGLQLRVVIDRDTASRLGITPQMIDDVLYDAFGQRQISIMFTQLNQYRVVLEVKPEFRNKPEDIAEHLHSFAARRARCRSSTFTRSRAAERRRWSINHQGQIPGGDRVVQPGARRLAGRRGRGDRGRQGRAGSAGQHSGQLSRNGRGVSGVAAATSRC